MQRREFMKGIRDASVGAAFLAAFPWFSAFSDEEATRREKARIGIIGPGSRGMFLMRFLLENNKAEIVALCDDYAPNLKDALAKASNARTYMDYRKLLEDKDVDAVVIATPPHLHCRMMLDSLSAGKHVFVEKAFSIDMDETLAMYQAYKNSGKVGFVGHQRMFDPKYLRIMERIHAGEFGEIQSIRTNWDRNADWRRPVPSPDLERKINWRLYKEYSRGLMTELASHQLQVGNWAMKEIPNKIMGHGAIVARKDGREVYDTVSTLFAYDNGVYMTFDSTNSNKFFGLEEKILCQKGTVTPEKGKYYMESIPPAPAILRMVNEVENKLFDAIPFAGTSWAPESANENKGEFILGKKSKTDGTSLLMDAFVEAVITGKRVPNLMEEGYYSSILCLMGHQAMEEGRIIEFPDKYKIDYLNHKAPLS